MFKRLHNGYTFMRGETSSLVSLIGVKRSRADVMVSLKNCKALGDAFGHRSFRFRRRVKGKVRYVKLEPPRDVHAGNIRGSSCFYWISMSFR